MRTINIKETIPCLKALLCLMVSLYVLTALTGCAIDFNTAIRPVTSAKSAENSYEPKKVRCLWGCNTPEQTNEAQGS